MGIGIRIQQLRINSGLTQEKLAEMLGVSRQSVSKWEMEQSLPEVDKIVLMSKLFGVGTNEILLEEADVKKLRPQELHLGSVYLIVRDFEKSIAFYEKLLSMTVSTRNCGNKFAEFFFDNKCLALMNEENLPGHHYVDGDHKFVLNFWVEDLKREYDRLRNLNIGQMTEIEKVHEGYYHFDIYDPDKNVCEITGGFHDGKNE
ncbi:MAG: helix-turn-helix domain-containing protein [Ruminiclostridium sp.]|nr:helix-turn-helix domain-containing protein [Ruminiclostridium sp.]